MKTTITPEAPVLDNKFGKPNGQWLGRLLLPVMASVFWAVSGFMSIAGAETMYGIDATGIYTVDSVTGQTVTQPATKVVTFAAPLPSAATLAVRPSDGVLFYLDSQAANPQLWRWDPSTPATPPVLIGSTGAAVVAVIRLGFDAAGTLYAMNPTPTLGVAPPASIYTLDPTSGAVLTQTPAGGPDGINVPGGGDLCLQPNTGQLYMVTSSGGGNTPSLFTVSPADAITRLGPITLSTGGTPANLPGCAFDSAGRLFVSEQAGGTNLYTVNIGTLVATKLGTTITSVWGDLATAPGQRADLRLTKTASNLTPGNQVTFTVIVSNSGPNRATDVRVKDQLPAGLTLFRQWQARAYITSVLLHQTVLAGYGWLVRLITDPTPP